MTCGNWTKSGEGTAMVGHADRMGLRDDARLEVVEHVASVARLRPAGPGDDRWRRPALLLRRRLIADSESNDSGADCRRRCFDLGSWDQASGLTPAVVITFSHLSISVCRNLPVSSGVAPTGITACSASRLRSALVLHRLRDLGRHLVDDLLRRAGRREEHHPARRFDQRSARSTMVGTSSTPGTRSFDSMASARILPARTWVITPIGASISIWMLPDSEIGQRRRRALVGDVHHVDAGHLLHQLAGEMGRRADARGAERDLARVLLGVGDQLADVLHRQVVGHRDDERRDADQRHRREARHRIELELAGIERLVGRMGRDHRQEGVAVRAPRWRRSPPRSANWRRACCRPRRSGRRSSSRASAASPTSVRPPAV